MKRARKGKVRTGIRERKKAAVGDTADEFAHEPQTPTIGVTIVGVGASAGGFEAFWQVLEAVDEDPGVAIVLVQHLAPQHESSLTTLLAPHTPMPVVEVTEGMRVQANRVYVIPPNAQMEVRDGHLHLNPRPADRTQYTPIDFFFRSLAEVAGSRAIGVILSGSSSDGAVGLRDIKAVGGIAIAQDPQTAKYDAMPRAAIAGEAVDLTLSPADIGKEIVRLGRESASPKPTPMAWHSQLAVEDDQMRRLIGVLRSASAVDFTHYKTPTIKRRLQRRMLLHRTSSVSQYLSHLQGNPDDARKLAQDILIHVTRFFREPDSFSALLEDVFPKILAKRTGENPIRLWVPGCSTGEEPYSVGIALLEHLGDQAGRTPIQIFATDVSDTAIDYARAGLYPQTISVDVSPQRLDRFFTRSDGGYRVSKLVRDLCVFARQDLTRDPPFSKLDLIVCRNVLIYLGSLAQKQLLSVFHYALKTDGFLMLGHAETVGSSTDLFAMVSRKSRIYRKKPEVALPVVPFAMDVAVPRDQRPVGQRPPEGRTITSVLSGEVQRILVDLYAPPGVVVDEDMRILQFLGHTGRYLEPAPGDAKLTLAKMVRDGLLHGFRTAFHQAVRYGRPADRSGLRVRYDGTEFEVTLHVVPLASGVAKQRHYLVLFQETPLPKEAREKKSKRSGKEASLPKRKDDRVSKLERELTASRDYLQSIIQELEAANEELQTANEEILSSNEELQSTNEELDTAKEELQSTNEELITVNEELHGRNEQLSRANNDLLNLLGSIPIALVMIESDLKIRRFTPMAEKTLNLIPSDVGRPIGHIKPNIDCPGLEGLIHQVIESVLPHEREVQDRQGRWLSLQIRPYKSVDNRIDGAVLALFDIDAAKRHESELRQARDLAQCMVDAVGKAMVVVDQELRVRIANRAFCETFGVSGEEAAGQRLQEVGQGEWNGAKVRSRLATAFSESADAEPIEIDVPGSRGTAMRVSARRVVPSSGSAQLLLTIEDLAHESRAS